MLGIFRVHLSLSIHVVPVRALNTFNLVSEHFHSHARSKRYIKAETTRSKTIAINISVQWQIDIDVFMAKVLLIENNDHTRAR